MAEELVDTGIQRLLGDLDELSSPVHGYGILEPPSRNETINSRPLSIERVRRYSPISSIVMTFGCKFACPYCPIPAYNQRKFRTKSPQRIIQDMLRLHKTYGHLYFFGTDDNFFNNKERAVEIVEELSTTQINGEQLGARFGWGTEATVHDTLKMKDYLPTARQAGLRWLWLGVEDLTATLVKKGQSVDKTTEAFQSLTAAGISPMPMMMHHDSQPLVTWKDNYGLLNQVKILRKAGAPSIQVTMLTPAQGTKLYRETYTSGQVFERVGGRRVEQYMIDGNYVVASNHKHPWKKPLNILASYLYFYNIVRLLVLIFQYRPKMSTRAIRFQVIGIYGLIHNIYRTLGWAFRLCFQKITRYSEPPCGAIPMRSPQGGVASHGGVQVNQQVSVSKRPNRKKGRSLTPQFMRASRLVAVPMSI